MIKQNINSVSYEIGYAEAIDQALEITMRKLNEKDNLAYRLACCDIANEIEKLRGEEQ